MDDSEFLGLFHDDDLPRQEFRHKGHLRLAWLVLSRHRKDESEQIVAREIPRFAVAYGASNRYHDTLTRFWVRLVGHAIENAPEARSIDDLLARFPFLLDIFTSVTGEQRPSTRTGRVTVGLNRTYFHC